LTSGLQPLANKPVARRDLAAQETQVPLAHGPFAPICWLLQILDLVPPVQLFSEYLYFRHFPT